MAATQRWVVLPSGALRSNEPFEYVRERKCCQILELSGIEKGAVTGPTLLEPDMRLHWVDHPNHWNLAPRTTISVEHVYEIAERGVSNIDRIRGLPIAQLFGLTGIEPEAETARTTIDLDTGHDVLFHLAVAFGTAHSTRPEAVARLADDDTSIDPD